MNKNLEKKLLVLAERYCKHDDRKYNSCLYHIFHDFIDKYFVARRDEEERLDFKKGDKLYSKMAVLDMIGEDYPVCCPEIKANDNYCCKEMEGYNKAKQEIRDKL